MFDQRIGFWIYICLSVAELKCLYGGWWCDDGNGEAIMRNNIKIKLRTREAMEEKKK